MFFFILSGMLLHHSILELILRNEKAKIKYFLKSIQWTARVGLKILNVNVHHTGVGGEVTNKLIVANHLSYLDVLILFSYYPALFITSVEIRETFLLGRVCKLAGCFFVERRKNHRTPETKLLELQMMKEKFSQGFNVFLFPEGTSSDGQRVLPFKSTFFQLAVDSQTSVQPMCLKYQGESALRVPWHGDMTFADHLFNLCMQQEITAHLTVLDEMKGSDRFILARNTQLIISEVYAKY